MKTTLLLVVLMACGTVFGQPNHTVDIPKGVVYHYCEDRLLDSAKALITKELTQTPTYALNARFLFAGPVLWSRFCKLKSLKSIEGGNVSNQVDGKVLPGKMTQSIEDSRKFWDALRAEIGRQTFELRLANNKELRYYWSVISFDIDEPLIVVATKDHNYILNLSPKSLELVWLDEAPR